tara:strand:- start:1673 stop:1843 length:171 start_codon:yes stop_codon:yes gene_type:complete
MASSLLDKLKAGETQLEVNTQVIYDQNVSKLEKTFEATSQLELPSTVIKYTDNKPQ